MVGVLVGGLLLCASAARADVVTTVVTDADAYVLKPGESGNTGSEIAVTLRSEVGSYRKGYFHFDLSKLGMGNVTDARLHFTHSGAKTTHTIRFFAILDESKDWDLTTLGELSINWNNAPQAGTAGTFVGEGTSTNSATRDIGSSPPKVNVDLDVTNLVQYLLHEDNGYSTFTAQDGQLTVLARIEGYDPGVLQGYFSKDYTPTDGSNAPRLVVTQEKMVEPIPEPTGLGLAGLAALLRRRRRY